MSVSSLLKSLVTVDAILINLGSCSFVSVSCMLHGHSDSGNSRKLGPFCQMLSKFVSLGFLPRVNQAAMLYLLSTQNHFLGLVMILLYFSYAGCSKGKIRTILAVSCYSLFGSPRYGST